MEELKNQLNDLLEIAKHAASEAGELLVSCPPESRLVEKHLLRDSKLLADRESEKIILDVLSSQSDYAILTEETGLVQNSSKPASNDPFWVVDPLDGSVNFSRCMPMCCTSIGLWSGSDPILGVVYDFNRGEIFSGVANSNATLDGKHIKVSETSNIQDAILCTGFPVNTDFSNRSLSNFVKHISDYKKIRLIGSAALSLAYVACGRVDSYIEEDIMLWDVAAGLAIVLGAGGSFNLSPGRHQWSYKVYASNNNITKNGV
ncbi:MAG TPA: inositol monophosphatase [Chloroflexi bacterium]|nr:inositol monophosphatase [Chloroflexota bacterium]